MNKNVYQLEIWKEAHALVLKTYKLTLQFPRSEEFALSTQFKRAAVSIAANIAEGYRKRSLKEKHQFLYTALGSLEECKYYSILSNDLTYIDDPALFEDFDRLGRRIYAFIKSLSLKNEK